ncbi:hypothetical protein AU255_04910 [Methyloprofundus sedimenti]|uniref:DUF2069 domain-containing protein n=1 Tax=Methyloprofundus sedimenti TaxID=1420851 RepID=A0A1V8M6R4_9GAMM|nr:DUF2069 domain-containing protein [Methyloprofundus sedimenti]OQK17235.1 hypothetical protein AU255_04910 [Methyloprofundus sedimenti]
MNARYYYAIAFCGYLGLFVLLMLWNTVLSPPEKLPVALALIVIVSPLLFVFRGFLKGNLKSCSWMAYLSMPYFIHGSIETYARTERLLPALEVLFSLMLFLGCTLFVRYSARNQ